MTIFDPTRVSRKIKSSGLTDTILSGWESVYQDKILKKYYLNRLSDDCSTKIIPRNSLQTASDNYWKVSNSNRRHIEIPIRTVLETDKEFNCTPRRSTAEPAVYEFQQGWILGPSGLGFTRNNQPIADTVGLPPAGTRRVAVALARAANEHGIRWVNNQLRSKTSKSASSTDVSAATTIIPLWNNYYHWLIECLPRLRYIQHYRKETGRDPIVFIPELQSDWMEEALELVDLNMDYRTLTQKRTFADRLVVPVYPDPSPRDLHWLKSRILENENPKTGPRRIYISREDATSRRVKNIDEVRSVLEPYNVKEYVLSECSVREQARIFAGADLIIAPHGAGLANIAFSSEGTSIIELFGNEKKTSYYRISGITGIEYYHLSGDSDGVDITVDTDNLRDTINDAINQ